MLEKVFITSFIVFAIHATMEEGMIFEFVQKWYFKATRKWSEEKADFWAKPIFSCCVCMGFWHGIYIYWIIYHNSWAECFLIIISQMGLNSIFTKIFPDK